MLRFGIAGLIVVAGVFAALHFLHRPAGSEAKVPPKVTSVALAPLTTNLADTSAVHLVQIGLTAKLVGDHAHAAWSSHLAAIQDVTIAALRARTSAQLSGAKAMDALAGQLTSAYDQILGNAGQVEAIYFTRFVVQ